MLPKKFRLRKKEEVDAVFQKGKSVSGAALAFRFLPNSLPQTRIAVLVGKKLSNKASQRNRIRRRLREVARLSIAQIPSGFDLLIIAREIKLGEMEFGMLMKQFQNLIPKLPQSKVSQD